MTTAAVHQALAPRPTIDVTDPQFYEDPAADIAWVHAHEPVYLCDPRPAYPKPFWIVSKWHDVRMIEKDDALFSRRDGPFLFDGPYATTGVPDDPRLADALNPLMRFEPAHHRRIRAVTGAAFRPSDVQARWEARIREIVAALLAEAPRGAPVDFMEAIAFRVPLQVTCEFLGIPAARSADFVGWADAAVATLDGAGTQDWRAIQAMLDYLEDELAARRACPRHDFLSHLVTRGESAGAMSRGEVMMMSWLTLVSSLKTTSFLLGGGLHALLEHPNAMASLQADRSLIAPAVEEMLRWTTPSRYQVRTLTADTELRGAQIGAGEMVMVNYLFANRDPEVFSDPWDFDVTRAAREPTHLAFGHGAHFCMGAPLARMQANVLFDELLQTFRRIEPAGTARYEPSSRVNAITSLPVVLEP